MVVLALDVGTSSARARVFDESGRAQPGAEGQVTYEPRTTPDGGVELDADLLLAAVTGALDACLAGCGARAAEIAAVGASVFWHSLLALDGAGRPLTPVITWADTRSAPAAAALRRAHDERRIHARTGAPLHAAFFPAKLRWLREARPDVFARAAVWCGFGEYLHARLTGRPATSLSMASGTGLLDQTTGGWDADMLAVAGIAAAQLPPIDDTAAPGLIAPHAARWPALAGVPWHPARGDGGVLERGLRLLGPAAGRAQRRDVSRPAGRLARAAGPARGDTVGALALSGGRPARGGGRRDVGGRQCPGLVPPAPHAPR
jgi:gluconokinase